MSDCISPYRTKAPEGGRFADLVQGPLPFFLTPATPALVARSQGGYLSHQAECLQPVEKALAKEVVSRLPVRLIQQG